MPDQNADRNISAHQQDELDQTYDRFLNELDPAEKERAGKNLIRAIFGKNAIADDPV